MHRIPILIVIAGVILTGVDRVTATGQDDPFETLGYVGLVVMAIGTALELLRRRRAKRSGQTSPRP